MERDWQGHVKGLLKSEIKRKQLSYRDLAERLTAMGIPENETNIRTKISRGGFTAVFFIQCLEAIGVKELRLG
jgi:3-mercaptopyruvate sulfurtransferase SseA